MTHKGIVEEMVEKALDILHECIQHTPIKIEQTNGTEYDKGYIFYQDMVVRDVLDNTPKLKELLTTTAQRVREETIEDFTEAMLADMNLNTPTELKELNEAFAEGVRGYKAKYLSTLNK